MGTRSGDIDPGIVIHLCRVAGLRIDDVDHVLNHRSGLLGLAGVNDMRDVHRLVAQRDADAVLALAIYVDRLKRYIGAYAAVMGGLDAITFTAGVGENDPIVRAMTTDGLGFLGIQLDPGRNDAPSSAARLISSDESSVSVLVVPTNEELEIAREVRALVRPP